MSGECLCCGRDLRPRFRIGDYEYAQCGTCGFTCLPGRFDAAHTARVYDDGYFTAGGAGYAGYDAEAATLRQRGGYYARILAPHSQGRRMLDVGCASGAILRGFADEGWDAYGIEPNTSMASQARISGLNVSNVTLEEFESLRAFDAVAMIQVAAHFFDIERAMVRAAKATREGGVWLFETWNARSHTARLFGSQWHELSPPSVLRIFTPRALTLLVARFGFRPVKMGRPPKRISAAHAKSLLAEKAQTGSFSALLHAAVRRIPDRFSLPYPGDDVFWSVYEKTEN